MPIIKFTGPDGPEQHEYRGLMLAEARHIQRVADLTVADFERGVFTANPDPSALTALVQVLWKRTGRVVKFDDVDFDLRTWDMDLLPEEEDEAIADGSLARCPECGQTVAAKPAEGAEPDPN